MRLDLFLKFTRLCPRRTIAQKLCAAGVVFLDGRPAKSAHAVKPGNEITIRRRNREIRARITKVPSTRSVSRREAAELIEILSDRELESLNEV